MSANNQTPTSSELLRRAVHLLAVWSPRWTPEMAQLEQEVTSHLAQIRELEPTVAEEVEAEIRAKAQRYTCLKNLAEASSLELEGFRIDSTVYPSFDAAFDALLAEAATNVAEFS